jgi:hypothetical protein
MVNWQDIDEAYAELQKARGEGQTSIMMRLSEMQLAIADALDAHVEDVVRNDTWSWQRVGDALGVTRQAASKRWTHKVFPR